MNLNLRVRRSPWLCVAVLGVGLTGAGCPESSNGQPQPSKNQLEGRGIKRDKIEPPLPEPEKLQPLDPTLAAAARDEFFRALHAPEEESRAHALEGERQTLGAERAADYLQGLSDGQPMVRFAAAMAIGELKVAAAKGRLLEMVNDKSANVRVAVRFALHRLGVFTYSHDLERTAHDPDPGVRVSTAMALGRIGEKSAARVLKVMRIDPNAAVRQASYEALWRLGEQQGEDDLAGLISSRYPDDQMVGLLALASTRDQRVREHIRTGLTAGHVEVQLVAARAFAMVSTPGPDSPWDLGFVVATNGARSKDPRQRLLAALALGEIARSDSQDTVRELLKDPDPNVRIGAAIAALQLSQSKR